MAQPNVVIVVSRSNSSSSNSNSGSIPTIKYYHNIISIIWLTSSAEVVNIQLVEPNMLLNKNTHFYSVLMKAFTGLHDTPKIQRKD